MDPLTAIAALNASITLTQTLLPVIAQMKNDGQITAEQQAELLAKYNSLRAQADGQFSGPQWQVSGK